MSELKKDEAKILTDSVSTMKCSKCNCEIDVEGIESFLQVECPDCKSVETIPAKFGSFILLNLLGTGGMGGVYIGKDEALGRLVAIKVMLKSLGDNLEFVESFKREAQAQARLNHPNIVQTYSFGQEKGQPYIVMELISGYHLDKLIEEKKQLDEGIVMQVAADIANGLSAANDAGLLHGDIKPENILLDEKLTAKLVDFGIASFANQSQPEGIWGTPYYIAPEKVKRQKPDHRSDIYSLGATLYYALAGRPPFEGKTPIDVVKARLTNDPKPIKYFRKDINPNIERIISRMLQLSPGMRYPTYASLLGDLNKMVQDLGGRKKNAAALKTALLVNKRTNATSDMAQPASQKSAKVVIAKKKSFTIKASSEEASSEKKQGDDGAAKGKSAYAPPPKKKSNAGIYVFLTILFLGLIGGAIGTCAYISAKNREERFQKIQLENAKIDASKKLGDLFKMSSNVVRVINENLSCADEATNVVKIVLGETMEFRKSAEPEQPPAKAPDAVAPAATNTPAAAQKAKDDEKTKQDAMDKKLSSKKTTAAKEEKYKIPGAEETVTFMGREMMFGQMSPQDQKDYLKEKYGVKDEDVAEKKEPEKAKTAEADPERKKEVEALEEVIVVDGREIPIGLASPEDRKAYLEKKKGKTPAAAPASTAVTTPAATTPAAPAVTAPAVPALTAPAVPALTAPAANAAAVAPPVPPPPPVDDDKNLPEAKRYAKKIITDVNALQEKATRLSEIETQGKTKRDEALAIYDFKQFLNAKAKVAEIDGLTNSVATIKDEVYDTINKMKPNIKKLDDIKKKFLSQQAIKKQAEEEAKKLQSAEADKQKAEEERQTKIKAEIEMAKSFHGEAIETIKAGKYQDAIVKMEAKEFNLKTDEGKATLKAYVDRVGWLLKLRTFLAQKISKTPFPGGWLQTKEDIINATDKEIKLKSKNIPWEQVNVKQMMTLVKRYILDNKDLSLRDTAEMQMSAAIYCIENGDMQPAALSRAADLAKKAADLNNSVASEIKRLLLDDELSKAPPAE